MKKFWNFIQNEDTSETELLFNWTIVNKVDRRREKNQKSSSN